MILNQCTKPSIDVSTTAHVLVVFDYTMEADILICKLVLCG